MKTRRVLLVAALVAGGAVLHALESLVPLPLPIPGAKLGLANLVTLIALDLAGPEVAVAVAVSRPVVGGLAGGGLLSLGFALALSGAVMSVLVMTALWSLSRRTTGRFRLTLVGLSLAGGVAHNLGQLSVASFYVGPVAAAAYVAPLVVAGLGAGYVVGRVAGPLCRVGSAGLPRDAFRRGLGRLD